MVSWLLVGWLVVWWVWLIVWLFGNLVGWLVVWWVWLIGYLVEWLVGRSAELEIELRILCMPHSIIPLGYIPALSFYVPL